jgi:hypothetical protein
MRKLSEQIRTAKQWSAVAEGGPGQSTERGALEERGLTR